MSWLTRRAALAALSGAPTALVTSPTRPADDGWRDLGAFLERATPAERMHYHLAQAAEAASEIEGGTWAIRCGLADGFMMIVDYDRCSRNRKEA